MRLPESGSDAFFLLVRVESLPRSRNNHPRSGTGRGGGVCSHFSCWHSNSLFFFHQAVQQRDKVHRENDMTTKKTCTDLTKRSRSPVVLEAEMFREFQDWCLRTYGDSGKTKTVTRRKYNKIMQTLLQNDDSDGVYVDNSHINAKFKFWVKSKGFQVGNNILGEHNKKGASGKPVLYVPVKSTVTCLFLQRYLGRHMKCFYLSWLLSVCASVFVFHTFHLKHINLLFICLRNAV